MFYAGCQHKRADIFTYQGALIRKTITITVQENMQPRMITDVAMIAAIEL